MILNTPRCLLRPWRMEDKAALIRHADNPKIARNMSDVYASPYTEADAEGWLNARSKDEGPCDSFAIEIDGEAAGGVGIHPKEDVLARTAELGYWLGEDYWSKGYMTEIVRTIAAYAFETFDYHRLEAYHYAWNPASGRVLEKVGFRLEGCLRERVCKQGKFTDCLFYGLLKEEAS